MPVVLPLLDSNYIDIPFFVLLHLVVLPCDKVDARACSPEQLMHPGSMFPSASRLHIDWLHAASLVKAI